MEEEGKIRSIVSLLLSVLATCIEYLRDGSA